jgi:hypothetical protein
MQSGFMLSYGALVRAGARAGSVQQAWEEPPARGGARQRQHHTSTASRVWVNELSRIMFRYTTRYGIPRTQVYTHCKRQQLLGEGYI